MLRAALIGFPSVGKTTLFRLMTSVAEARDGARRQAAHVGVARVPDPRLDRLVELYRPRRRVPATVELTEMVGHTATRSLLDVAAFRNADALLHVVRAFRDERVAHVSGSVEPLRDARTMEDELILADLGVAERRLDRLAQDLKKIKNDDLTAEHTVLEQCRVALEAGTPLRRLSLDPHAAKRLRGFQFLSAKPLLLVNNLDEADLPDRLQASASSLAPFLEESGAQAVSVCAKIELEISQLDPDAASAFSDDLGLTESGLNRIVRASYELLGYVSFFTVGDDECRAWTLPRGTSAREAAGEIHSDISRGFIRAEVVAYTDLVAHGSLPACRDHGLVRLEGKDYVVQDGNVINFRFAT